MTLADLSARNPCRITGFKQHRQATGLGRLQSLGVVTGACAEVLRVAPLGDPLQVDIEGTLLSIRRRDARHIEVEPL